MISEQRTTVSLPNLAVSFLAQQPKINENYELAGRQSEEWVNKACELDEKGRKILEKGDFAYFVAVAVPFADLTRYRVFSDWVHWVFPFDDIFDVGHLKNDPDAAKVVLDNLADSMHGYAPCIKFVEAHQKIYARMRETASEETCRRFRKAIADYCTNVHLQVQNCYETKIRRPEELIELRRDTIGVRPLFVFVEYAHELDLPDEVMDLPLVKEIETLGVDWVLIQNDLISYRQEEEEGVNHNLVSASRLHGMDAQEAFDYLGSKLEKIYHRFDQAVAELPRWGNRLDDEIQTYVQGIQNCVKANLHWSFRTERYFGKSKDEVKETGLVDVLKIPPYLSGGVSSG